MARPAWVLAVALSGAPSWGCHADERPPAAAIVAEDPPTNPPPDPPPAPPASPAPVAEPPASCVGQAIEIGAREVTQLDDRSLWFRAGLAIDADGSPRAYHPDDTGLDYLANAGKPGNWWALVLDDDGQPIVQGPDDPAPGYYVSTTSLVDRSYPVSDPRRYVDAETIPFVVLPPRLRAAGATLGDLAVVVELDSGKRSFAIFADIGPKTGLGEGSIALARALGVPADPRRGGQAEGLAYLVWPGSGDGKPLAPAQIDARGQAELDHWGGEDRLARCLAR